MNRVKPWTLLLLLAMIVGCAPEDSNDPSPVPKIDGNGDSAVADTGWAEIVGDKVVVNVMRNDSAIVIPSFYGLTEKDIEYDGAEARPVQTSCDPETFGPVVLGEGEWSINPRFYEGNCAVESPVIASIAARAMVFSGEHTIIFRFDSSIPGEPGNITYITIIMEGLETGDTTDM